MDKVSELNKIKKALDEGIINQAEFEELKKEIIAVVLEPKETQKDDDSNGKSKESSGFQKDTIKKYIYILLSVIIVALLIVGLNTSLSEKRIIKSEVEEKENLIYHNGELFTGVIFEKYENEQLKNEATYKEGKLDGNMISYYEHGKKKSIGLNNDGSNIYVNNFYEDGVTYQSKDSCNGDLCYLKSYYQNGNLKLDAIEKDGKPHGITKEYYENEQLKIEKKYNEGVINGTVLEYYENGQMKQKSVMKNDKLVEKKKWDENGKEVIPSKYKAKSVNYVLGRLKSPGTARLVQFDEPAKAKKLLTDAGFTIPLCYKITRVVVDAQNSYGGYMRSFYFVFCINGVPCHMESAKSLNAISRSGSYSKSQILRVTLGLNACKCK
jgi:antitoxin component YwqK of YwqJK toxin-antitoxin module